MSKTVINLLFDELNDAYEAKAKADETYQHILMARVVRDATAPRPVSIRDRIEQSNYLLDELRTAIDQQDVAKDKVAEMKARIKKALA